jgi:16S rRNA (cytosine967-C5)-methyltransferase
MPPKPTSRKPSPKPGRISGRAPAGARAAARAEHAELEAQEAQVARVTARTIAIDALVRVEEGGYAQLVLPALLGATSLSSRDRAFATDLVYGAVRSERRIDDLIGRVVTRPLHRLDPPVRAALRVGAYQLLSGMKPHAAVGETVEAIGARSPRAKGFVNGNLRSLSRLGPPFPEPEDPAVALSYPDWLVARLTDALGAAEAWRSLAAMNEPASMTLRANVRVATQASLMEELGAIEGVDLTPGTLVADAVRVTGVGDPRRLPAVAEGRATPQDEGSQAVVEFLAPVPGERVVDVAAAPGGKATAIAERGGPSGRVVALDLDAGRTRLVAEAAARLSLPWLHVGVADARRPPLRPGTFDRVLLDAPCSGIGVLRRRPDARWRLTPEVIDECAALQRELLLAAAELVKPGGRLVYSVCTLTPEETLGIDEFAAEHLPRFNSERPTLAQGREAWRMHGRGALLLPYARGTDGMYVLVLRAPG